MAVKEWRRKRGETKEEEDYEDGREMADSTASTTASQANRARDKRRSRLDRPAKTTWIQLSIDREAIDRSLVLRRRARERYVSARVSCTDCKFRRGSLNPVMACLENTGRERERRGRGGEKRRRKIASTDAHHFALSLSLSLRSFVRVPIRPLDPLIRREVDTEREKRRRGGEGGKERRGEGRERR